MGAKLQAVGFGAKHFFSFGGTKQLFIAGRAKLKSDDSVVSKAQALAILSGYLAFKGTPFHMIQNAWNSLRTGKWRYDTLKEHQNAASDVLAQSGMSAQGQQELMRVLSGGHGTQAANLSPGDMNILRGMQTEVEVAAGNCVNF